MSSLGIYPKKYFNKDIRVFRKKLKDKEVFTFSKFADGEWLVLEGKRIDNKEFRFVNSLENIEARESLENAIRFQHPNYYVGVSCPCCQGNAFESMVDFSGQPLEKLTWANLWVNSNYKYYKSYVVPLFKQYKTVLVANKDSNIENLPKGLKPEIFCPIEKNAWIDSKECIETLKDAIDKHKMKGWLFLFCAGPFGNILAHQLTEYCDKNTYLDIGSTLNPFLGTEGFRRSYFRNHKELKPCVWR